MMIKVDWIRVEDQLPKLDAECLIAMKWIPEGNGEDRHDVGWCVATYDWDDGQSFWMVDGETIDYPKLEGRWCVTHWALFDVALPDQTP